MTAGDNIIEGLGGNILMRRMWGRMCAGGRTLLFVVLALLAGGCAAISLPETDETPKQELSKNQMLEILQRSYAYTGLQALAEVRLSNGKDSQSSTQALHVHAPYQLRAEVYNFMGQMLVLLVADGAHLEAYVPSRKTLYRGMATRARMEQFAYIPLMPADMVALLLLRLPPGVVELAQVEHRGDNALRFVLSPQQEYVVHFGKEEIQRIAYLELGREVYSITYADALPASSIASRIFPHSMTLSMPSHKLELEIELEDVKLNPELNPELFEIEARTGVEMVPLEEI